MARPIEYNEEIADKICAEIATTTKSLKTICLDGSLPTAKTIFKWIKENEQFRNQYARAKDDQLQGFEEDILEIADNTHPGEIVTIKGDGSQEIKYIDMLEHRKLQIESRKWLMGKLKPKKYGDKVDVTSAGEKIQSIQVEVIHAAKNTNE